MGGGGRARQVAESAVADPRGILGQGDKEALEAKMKTPTAVSHKPAEQMYAQASSGGPAGGQPGRGGNNDGPPAQDDNVVDVDFEEVDPRK